MDRNGLINKVKIKLDELTPDGVVHPIDDFIVAVMDESVLQIILDAPLHLLPPTDIPVSGVEYDDDSAFIPVPSDFARLSIIKYPVWREPVHTLISVENPEYKKVFNTHLKPGTARPMVVIGYYKPSTTLNKFFRCMKVEDPSPGSLTPQALYVKKLKPQELDDTLAGALSWLTAANIFEIQGEKELFGAAMEQYKNQLINQAY